MPEDKKPDDEFSPFDADDLLDDDEIDIEALLEDDDVLSLDDESGEEKADRPAASAARRPGTVDDVVEVTADDLLDDDDLLDLAGDKDAAIAADLAHAESGSESATDALLGGLDDELDLSTASGDEGTTPLGDVDEDPTSLLGEEPVPAAASLAEEDDGTAPLGDVNDDPTARLDDDGEEAAPAPSPVKGKKKSLARGKSARQKPERFGRKPARPEKPAKAPKPARAAKKKPAAKPARQPAPRRQRTTAGSIAFICSECYEEFLLPTNYAQEAVTCPECLHVGKRPDENFLNTVLEHKKGERTSFATVLAVAALLVVALLFWIWSASPYSTLELESTMQYGVMGVTGLLGAILIWLTVKFEGNRWEVYF